MDKARLYRFHAHLEVQSVAIFNFSKITYHFFLLFSQEVRNKARRFSSAFSTFSLALYVVSLQQCGTLIMFYFCGSIIDAIQGLWSQNDRNSDFMVVGPIKRAYFSSGKRLDLQIGL